MSDFKGTDELFDMFGWMNGQEFFFFISHFTNPYFKSYLQKRWEFFQVYICETQHLSNLESSETFSQRNVA